MKSTLLTAFFFAFALPGKSQMLEATYLVTKDITISTAETGAQKIASLQSIGYLYRKNNRYIYFQKPAYLGTYPDGAINIDLSANHKSSISLCMDTVQRINYVDLDSLVKRHRMDISGKDNVTFNYVQRIEPDFFSWTILPDKKQINGLSCQKATLTLRGQLQWEVWFCPDVPMQAGVFNIIGLPGLVVEADCIPLKTHFQLQTYTTNTNISDTVFWPAEFEQEFKPMATLKKSTAPAKPTKLQRQAELTNQ